MGPRQYYRGLFSGKKVSSAESVKGISYTFDDIGSCMQNENKGEWIEGESASDMKYRLETGDLVTRTWYQVDLNWYYFDKDGNAVKDRFMITNGKKYYLNSEGIMQTGVFSVEGDRYYAGITGVVKANTEVFINGNFHETDLWGRVGKTVLPGCDGTNGISCLMVDGKLYYKQKPEYFFRKDYDYLFEFYQDNNGSFPHQDGESFGFFGKSVVYKSDAYPDQLFVYERNGNLFFSYTTEPASARDYL